MSFCRQLVWAALGWLVANVAVSATYRVDDSGSLPQDLNIPMTWALPAPSRQGNANADSMIGQATVALRLNLAPWVGRRGRIYLVLPESPAGRVRAQWPGRGRLLEGRGESGQRVLIYAGLIVTPQFEETQTLRLAIDGTNLQGAMRLQFNFEIDVD